GGRRFRRWRGTWLQRARGDLFGRLYIYRPHSWANISSGTITQSARFGRFCSDKNTELLGSWSPQCRPDSGELPQVYRSLFIQGSHVIGHNFTREPEPHGQMRSPSRSSSIGVERTDSTGGAFKFIGGFQQPRNSLFTFGAKDDHSYSSKAGGNDRRK